MECDMSVAVRMVTNNTQLMVLALLSLGRREVHIEREQVVNRGLRIV